MHYSTTVLYWSVYFHLHFFPLPTKIKWQCGSTVFEGFIICTCEIYQLYSIVYFSTSNLHLHLFLFPPLPPYPLAPLLSSHRTSALHECQLQAPEDHASIGGHSQRPVPPEDPRCVHSPAVHHRRDQTSASRHFHGPGSEEPLRRGAAASSIDIGLGKGVYCINYGLP